MNLPSHFSQVFGLSKCRPDFMMGSEKILVLKKEIYAIPRSFSCQ
jgi:hypothetical protein